MPQQNYHSKYYDPSNELLIFYSLKKKKVAQINKTVAWWHQPTNKKKYEKLEEKKVDSFHSIPFKSRTTHLHKVFMVFFLGNECMARLRMKYKSRIKIKGPRNKSRRK